ncbi:MAG: hypothetical protein EZS28_026850, partial [Streblomastix strix]
HIVIQQGKLVGVNRFDEEEEAKLTESGKIEENEKDQEQEIELEDGINLLDEGEINEKLNKEQNTGQKQLTEKQKKLNQALLANLGTQNGPATNSKNLAKQDLLTMIRHGANEILNDKNYEGKGYGQKKEKEKQREQELNQQQEKDEETRKQESKDMINNLEENDSKEKQKAKQEQDTKQSSSSSSSSSIQQPLTLTTAFSDSDLDELLAFSAAKTDEWNKKMEKKGENLKLVFDGAAGVDKVQREQERLKQREIDKENLQFGENNNYNYNQKEKEKDQQHLNDLSDWKRDGMTEEDIEKQIKMGSLFFINDEYNDEQRKKRREERRKIKEEKKLKRKEEKQERKKIRKIEKERIKKEKEEQEQEKEQEKEKEMIKDIEVEKKENSIQLQDNLQNKINQQEKEQRMEKDVNKENEQENKEAQSESETSSSSSSSSSYDSDEFNFNHFTPIQPIITELAPRERLKTGQYDERQYYREAFNQAKMGESHRHHARTPAEREQKRINKILNSCYRPVVRIPYQFYPKRYNELMIKLEQKQIEWLGKVGVVMKKKKKTEKEELKDKNKNKDKINNKQESEQEQEQEVEYDNGVGKEFLRWWLQKPGRKGASEIHSSIIETISEAIDNDDVIEIQPD